jgi:FKBP-type peptidyl-prolyl cis-trans isomerase
MSRHRIRIVAALLVAAIVTPLVLAQQGPGPGGPGGPMPEPTKEEMSKMIGKNIAQMLWGDLKRNDREVDPDIMAKTIADTMKELDKKAAANLAEGKAYLAANARKDGVKTTDSGLQYKVIEKGEGETPAATDEVTVHYEGTLIDGTVFDSSYKRGEPVTFPLNGVIPGWTEGVQLMKPGAKYEFAIPSDLAYGLTPRPGSPIGPNETLLFTVELIEVKEGEEKPAQLPMFK